MTQRVSILISPHSLGRFGPTSMHDRPLQARDKGPAGKTIGFELERILIDRTGNPLCPLRESGV